MNPPEVVLRNRRVLVGVTGGIAAYKTVELVRLLVKAGAIVDVVMTEAATRFVGPATFAAISHRPVRTSLDEEPELVPHVRLAREADAIVIAPATANTLAALRAGLAADLLQSIALMARCPIVCAAAMHTEMWEHDATRDNVAVLRARGVTVLDPVDGDLAGGDTGIGRMLEPFEIRDALAGALATGVLAGVRFLVTAGGTQEPIDAVRFIANRSSGKMGYAVVEEALRRGATVTLVSGPTALAAPTGCELVSVRTAAEMAEAVLSRFDVADVVVKAAAVADFTVPDPSPTKLKKHQGPPPIQLAPTIDILATLGQLKAAGNRGQILVGFSAETHDHLAAARKKLDAKHLDLIAMNDVSRRDIGFDADANEILLLDRDGRETHLERRSKAAIARELLDRITALLVERRTGRGDL